MPKPENMRRTSTAPNAENNSTAVSRSMLIQALLPPLVPADVGQTIVRPEGTQLLPSNENSPHPPFSFELDSRFRGNERRKVHRTGSVTTAWQASAAPIHRSRRRRSGSDC